MLERSVALPPGVDGVKAVGRVTKADYESVLEPMLEEAQREGRRIRLLYEVGDAFEGFTPGALWEDARVGLLALGRFDGCALVSDRAWLRKAVHLFGLVLPFPVREFGRPERDEAVRWLASLPEHAAA